MAQVQGDALAESPHPGYTGKRGQMSEGELKGILNAKVTNSLGYYGGKLAKARLQALQYYNGEPFGNEQEGRSQVVSRDVAESIDGMMPSLMKIFMSGDEIVRFDAQKPEDEKIAQQATDYINWIWQQQNEGFRNTFIWFKDALLTRAAALKIWWDDQEEVSKEQYEGLTDQEYELLLEDADEEELEILEHETYPDPNAPLMSGISAPMALGNPGQSSLDASRQVSAPGMPPQTAPGPGLSPGISQMGAAGAQPNPALPPSSSGVQMPGAGLSGAPLPGAMAPPPALLGHNMPPAMLHDVTLRRTNRTGRIRIMPIPGEEFLMDRRAVALDGPDQTPFCAHRVKKTLSDLLEMGYEWDLIKDLGEGDSSDFNLERLERFRQEDELPYRTGNNYDPSMKEVWINECYLKVDYDGDGIAEMRKITFAGESGNFAPGATVILDNEEIDDHPFAAITPIPMPHKFYGQGIADIVGDLQLVKSTLWRTVLDHGYNAIMPQVEAVEGQVNLDDLLTRRPGGVIRVKAPGMVREIPNGALGVDPYQLIAYADQVREGRTGVQRFTAGPSADALQPNAYTDTATGVNTVENASQERIELIARCYAEIGVKPAFRKILKLVSKYQQKPKIIRLRGTWVAMDPREWDTEFDVTVSVGLGTGNRSQQIQGILAMLAQDEKIVMAQQGMSGPLVTWETTYNKLAKLVQYLGLKSADPYYQDPTTHPMPQQGQKPDPKVQAAQISAQADQAKTQAQIQADHARLQAEMQADHAKAMMQAQSEQQRDRERLQFEQQKLQAELQMKERIEMAKLQADRQMDAMRLATDRQEFATETGMELHRHATDTALRGREMNDRRALGEQANKAKTEKPEASKPTPKLKKVRRVRDEKGNLSGIERHYDDGSMEHVAVE